MTQTTVAGPLAPSKTATSGTRDRAATTVVVGHGKSPEGKGWGPLIDSADRVVRMWEWQWQTPADYGTRYDFGIIETHRSTLARFDEHNEREPSSGWVASILQLFRGLDDALPPRTQVVDQRRWIQQEGQHIGGVGVTGKWELTRGGIAACWAIATSGTGSTVILVGCDNLRIGKALPIKHAFSAAYIEDPATASFHDYVEGAHKTGNHDFAAERKLIEHMARGRGVNVYFAQDLWTGR